MWLKQKWWKYWEEMEKNTNTDANQTTVSQQLPNNVLCDRFKLCRSTQWKWSVVTIWAHTLRQIWTSTSVLKLLLRQWLWVQLHLRKKPGKHWQINTNSYFRPQLEMENKSENKSEIIFSATRGQLSFTAVGKSSQDSLTDLQCCAPHVSHSWLKVTVQFNEGITRTPNGYYSNVTHWLLPSLFLSCELRLQTKRKCSVLKKKNKKLIEHYKYPVSIKK